MPEYLNKLDLFTSPYDQYASRNGQPFVIVRPLTGEEIGDPDEVGAMFLVRFEDGEEINAWPEEIFSDQGRAYEWAKERV